MSIKHFHIHTGCAVVIMLLTACEGLFEGIYDQPPTESKPTNPTEAQTDSDSISGQVTVTIEGSLYIDASSWENWYYVDFKAMADSVAARRNQDFTPIAYPIPTTLTGESDGKTGIYTYWFDVWNQGLSVNERRHFEATDPQPEPANWTFAVHRNNVRTNGGSAYETSMTDIKDLTTAEPYKLTTESFTPDQWSETEVWADQSQMLLSLIGCQGIKVNPVLSSWLQIAIPPMPPAFTLNNHVFILRLNDGTYAALQLENYQSTTGTKCCLTINYKYPL